MIDWTKPVRWVDDKAAAEVLKVNEDGGAWVIESNGCRAFRYDAEGAWEGGRPTLENIPEPVEPNVSWAVITKCELHARDSEEDARDFLVHYPHALALLRITYTPGHASVEIIEERK